MVSPEGSAAVAMQAPPESANTDSRRWLREELPHHLDRMERALRVARGALNGPDPEAAIGYLAVLDDRLREVLTRHQ